MVFFLSVKIYITATTVVVVINKYKTTFLLLLIRAEIAQPCDIDGFNFKLIGTSGVVIR